MMKTRMRPLVLLSCAVLISTGLLVSHANGESPPTEQRISVDFERTNIENVFRAFGEMMRLNIVLHPSVRGTVSLHLRDTPLGESFETLLRIKGLYAVREGSIVLIYPLDILPGE